MNKKEEEYLFKQFLENYSEMPIGTKEFKDRPDVIYTTTEGKKIGIEITECIYDEDSKSKYEFQTKFNYDLVNQLQDKLPFNFILEVELNNKIPLKRNRKDSVINDLITFCKKEFINLNLFETKQFENLDLDWNNLDNNIKQLMLSSTYRKLPPEIFNICLTRNDNLEKCTHFESAFGMVPNFSEKDLNAILKKKNKSLKNYSSCDEQWLLIIEGWDFYSYFADIENINEIQTEFNKILMFRRFTNEVVLIM